MRGSDNDAIVQEIRTRLHRKGRLTFAELMDVALYLPGHGYYASDLPRHDYRTSPQTHPLFGALVALQLEQMWRLLGSSSEFRVVEFGAGEGDLCRDVLQFAACLHDFAEALRYTIVERIPEGIRRQKHIIGPAGKRVEWVRGSAVEDSIRDVVGCIISNELVDSFPVHRVALRDGVLRECYVVERDGGLAEVFDRVSTREVIEHFDIIGLLPAEGCLAEVNLYARRFLRCAALSLARGFLLTIDYGGPAEEIFSRRGVSGTLRSFHRHIVGEDVFGNLGRQDLTSDVDFSTLILAGHEAGLHLAGLVSQREFLRNLGFAAFADQVDKIDLPAGQRFNNKFAMQELVSKAGLGDFRVLAQYKGLHDVELDGFNPCNDLRRALVTGRRQLPAPLLVSRQAG